MKDDYLWDKSGEPDPEIQQLEELLGTLRYQPKALEIPDELPVGRQRSYFPLLAIAATLLIAVLSAALWFRAQKDAVPQQQQQARSTPSVIPTPIQPQNEKEVVPPQKETQASNTPVKRIYRPRTKSPESAMNKREREEALAAKQQLVFALRLASEKLSIVQRKTQHPASPNQIRNQHKVG